MINRDYDREFNTGFFAFAFQFWFDFCTPFPGCPQWVIINYSKIRIQNSLMCVFDWRAKTIAVCAPFWVAWQKCCPSTSPWEFPNKAIDHMQHTLCQVLKHGDEPSDCESSCLCYYSYIFEGLGLHAVYITRYVVSFTKHLHNWIEIIKIERQ